MIRIPFQDITARIKESTGISEEEILKKVEEKIQKLSGLVSREGAARIVANELGVKLIEQPKSQKLQIKNLMPGIRDVGLTGVAIQVYETREFSVGSRQGRVASFLLGDETGKTRVVAWNNMADGAANLKQGDTVKIQNAYVKDRDGRIEVHLNERSQIIINPEGEKIEINMPKRKKINEITEEDTLVELMGTIVQMQDPRFFEVCQQCGRRARAERPEEGFKCEIHGIVEPRYSYLINIFLDDGTENMRVVCFRNQALKLLGKTDTEMLELRAMPEMFEQTRSELLATAVKVNGNVRRNVLFDTIEVIAQQLELQKEQINEMGKIA